MDLTYEQRLRFAEMRENYKAIEEYGGKTKALSYVQFDYDVVHGLTLFMLKPDFDFEELERHIDAVLAALPAIKRIFEQPFIHLKEQNVIMPVEAVRIVNNATLTHIASHSELWGNVKNAEIKPDKLLTRTYEDNYGIYENLVFCNVVDEILSFARANIRFLKELVYTNKTVEINLLERVNHLNYFLALGKLHIGYSKSFDAYYAIALRCLNKLQFIVGGIVPRLKRPVYKNNRKRPASLKIRKTNILSMHKEYHRVYRLAKYFAKQSALPVGEITEKDVVKLQNDYYFFCRALCIFAVGHFNFCCDEKKSFDFKRVLPRFEFKGWTVDIKSETAGGVKTIALNIKKENEYKILLIPSVERESEALLNKVKSAATADEYIVCAPYEEREGFAVYIDITSIESFRRLQQMILRGMIYADAERTECPFCNNKLSVNKEKSSADETVYECGSCRTEIHETRCVKTNKPYAYTKIAGLKPLWQNDAPRVDDRDTERALYFRNITDIDAAGEPVCPHCGTQCRIGV